MKKPYHHGDLRQSLLDTGLQLLREGGIEAVSLRAVARKAGVSHTAPYHHFSDKADLVEALAIESFRRFTLALQTTWETNRQDPLTGLAALGSTYVNFALAHPEEFRLMHLPGLRQVKKQGGHSRVSAAATQAYAVLCDAVSDCQTKGLIAPGDPNPYALTAWSSVHGLAVLILDGLLLGEKQSASNHDYLINAIINTLSTGLKPRAGA
ncbi:MAG: TetR/AcrR family transcriptional regulator [Gammaproteobacteria bacterium]